LAEFVADVFGSLPRRDQRRWGECYLRGLMLDGRRESVQPMAERLPDGNMQALQQFVNQSPWDPLPVRRRIAERLSEVITPEVWVVDDVSFPKCGRASVGVARQYCGAVGKRANCQVASASMPPPTPLHARCRGSGRTSRTAAAAQEFPTMSSSRRSGGSRSACSTRLSTGS
jgi:SRSO17 transposase